MSRQFFAETLAVATQDGTALANTTTETAIFPAFVLPANYMQDGRLIWLRAFGKLSTTATPTIIFAIRWGGAAGTLLATTEAVTTASGSANTAWSLDALIQVRTNGATGTLLAMGDARINLTASTQTAGVFCVSGFDAPAPVTVDLTADTNLCLTGKWSAASASNSLTGMIFAVVSLN
jgi:hypothetical protein